MTIGVNKSGTDWGNTKKWLLIQIEKLHRQMEQPLSLEEYNQVRGSILMARELIEAVEPTTPPKTAEDDYGISSPD